VYLTTIKNIGVFLGFLFYFVLFIFLAFFYFLESKSRRVCTLTYQLVEEQREGERTSGGLWAEHGAPLGARSRDPEIMT